VPKVVLNEVNEKPYYNKPTQEGLYQHFRAVAREVRIPIILYNVPTRTSVNLLPETISRLTEFKNIVGIKEATGDLKQIGDLISLCGDRMIVLSGDDFTTLPILAIGGKGVISVTANVAPRDVSDMVHAYLRGDEKEAVALHNSLWPLNKAMFLETNPIPVKTALGMMGMIDPEMRLPLAPMSMANREKLSKTLKPTA
jgi:4-hydroxy-tetrahydrodipicolinate synthase